MTKIEKQNKLYIAKLQAQTQLSNCSDVAFIRNGKWIIEPKANFLDHLASLNEIHTINLSFMPMTIDKGGESYSPTFSDHNLELPTISTKNKKGGADFKSNAVEQYVREVSSRSNEMTDKRMRDINVFKMAHSMRDKEVHRPLSQHESLPIVQSKAILKSKISLIPLMVEAGKILALPTVEGDNLSNATIDFVKLIIPNFELLLKTGDSSEFSFAKEQKELLSFIFKPSLAKKAVMELENALRKTDTSYRAVQIEVTKIIQEYGQENMDVGVNKLAAEQDTLYKLFSEEFGSEFTDKAPDMMYDFVEQRSFVSPFGATTTAGGEPDICFAGKDGRIVLGAPTNNDISKVTSFESNQVFRHPMNAMMSMKVYLYERETGSKIEDEKPLDDKEFLEFIDNHQEMKDLEKEMLSNTAEFVKFKAELKDKSSLSSKIYHGKVYKKADSKETQLSLKSKLFKDDKSTTPIKAVQTINFSFMSFFKKVKSNHCLDGTDSLKLEEDVIPKGLVESIRAIEALDEDFLLDFELYLTSWCFDETSNNVYGEQLSLSGIDGIDMQINDTKSRDMGSGTHLTIPSKVKSVYEGLKKNIDVIVTSLINKTTFIKHSKTKAPGSDNVYNPSMNVQPILWSIRRENISNEEDLNEFEEHYHGMLVDTDTGHNSRAHHKREKEKLADDSIILTIASIIHYPAETRQRYFVTSPEHLKVYKELVKTAHIFQHPNGIEDPIDFGTDPFGMKDFKIPPKPTSKIEMSN